jgi:D-alanyl-D-alanine dipeptidase
MTGEYDEMSERSHVNYSGGTKEQRKLRDLLISKMEKNGFTVYDNEWWHFDYKDWQTYRIQNIQFSDIK